MARYRLAADAAARYAGGFGHLRQNFLVLACGNAAQQRPHHALGGDAVLLQSFIRRHFHFAFLLVAKPRALHFQLAVGEHDPAIL